MLNQGVILPSTFLAETVGIQNPSLIVNRISPLDTVKYPEDFAKEILR